MSPRLERFGWTLLVLALTGATAWQTHKLKQTRSEMGQIAAQKLRDQAPPLDAKGHPTAPLLSAVERRGLQQAGLLHPEKQLTASLMEHRDLIPATGELGGTMGFYTPDAIHILGDRWVMAEYEDGHNAGKILLRYRVDAGKIAWEVLDSEKF